MSNNDLFQRVRDLKLPIGKYALFGSAPLGIRKLRNCCDVDIIVTEDLWKECQKVGLDFKVMPSGSPCLFRDKIEIFKDWQPGHWDIQKLINEAEIIDGLPFVKIQRVLEWKKLGGREKDLKDIEIIEKFLRT